MGIIGVIGIIVGAIMIINTSTGRDAFWWTGKSSTITIFVFGIIITLVGIALGITALAKGSKENKPNILADTKKCPFCANYIKREAIVCQFCGKDLPNIEISESIPTADYWVCPQCSKKKTEKMIYFVLIVEEKNNSGVAKCLPCRSFACSAPFAPLREKQPIIALPRLCVRASSIFAHCSL